MVTAAAAVPAVGRVEQIARAEQMARVAERNMAVAQRGAAQTKGTCPWALNDGEETASTASSRQPSSRNTCPWGADNEAAAPKSKKVSGFKGPQDTCPWSSNANDKDTARLADAAKRRQKPSPSNCGRAGAGAPKMFGREDQNPIAEMAPPARAPAMTRDAAEVTQRFDPAPAPMFNAEPVADDADDAEQDQDEQREIINQCLAEGLSEERIMEILEEWQNDKLIQQTQNRMQAQAAAQQYSSKAAAPSRGAPQPEALGVCGSSLAASRQAKAAKSLSFGPSDDEIVGVLNEYTKENVTPPESPPNALTLAAKRAKDKAISEASVKSYDADKAKAAYLESRNQRDAVKNKQRLSPGIF